PLPTYQFGSTWRRFCHSAPTTSAPAVVARLASSVSESSALQPVSSPVSTATRNAFATGGVRSMAVWRGTAEGYRASRGGSAGEASRGGNGRFDRWSGGRVQPVDPGLGPEPGPLALRERLVAAGVLGDRGVASQLAVQDGPCLAVADRGEGRQPRVEVLPERPGLLDQARLELAAGPVGDPRPVCRRLDGQADPGDRPVVVAGGRQVRLAAGDGRDLERPNDAARVGGVDRGSPLGRDAAQPLDERL